MCGCLGLNFGHHSWQGPLPTEPSYRHRNFKDLLIYVYGCVSLCAHQKGTLDPLGVELQAFVSHVMWVWNLSSSPLREQLVLGTTEPCPLPHTRSAALPLRTPVWKAHISHCCFPVCVLAHLCFMRLFETQCAQVFSVFPPAPDTHWCLACLCVCVRMCVSDPRDLELQTGVSY